MRNTLPKFFLSRCWFHVSPPVCAKISQLLDGVQGQTDIPYDPPFLEERSDAITYDMEYRLGCMRQHFIILILAIQVHNPYTRVCHWHIESVVRSCSSQWRGLSGIVLCLQLVFSVTVASQNEIWQSWIIAAYTKKICANLFLCLGNFSYLENIQASWFFCHQVCGYQNHTSKTVETKSKTIRPNRYFFLCPGIFSCLEIYPDQNHTNQKALFHNMWTPNYQVCIYTLP